MSKGLCFADGRDVQTFLEENLGDSLCSIEILNHRGFLSLKVKRGGEIYKVAECESPQRAVLAEKALVVASGMNGPVPDFLLRKNSVIICRWVHGSSCSKENQVFQEECIMGCQEALFKTLLPSRIDFSVQYVHLESLLFRLLTVGTRVISSRRAKVLTDILRERLPRPGPPRIIHPDLTPGNVVINEGNPIIIDNEVIAIGAGNEFDIWNSGEAIYGHRDPKGIERYVRRFHERCPLPSLFEYQSLWDDFRILRRALKSIEKGRFIKARRLIARIDSRLDL